MNMPLGEKASNETRLQREMARKLVLRDTFGDRIDDKSAALAVFHEHIEKVRSSIDPARLLVFDVAEGWGPLCSFLGVPEPTEPFPRLNDTLAFQAMMKRMGEASS